MRARVLVGLGVVVVVIAALIGWRSCGHSSRHGGAAGSATGDGPAGTRVAKATRPRGPVKPASLGGRVVKKSDGSGIAGAVVSIARAELIKELMPSSAPTLIVVTDAQGAWTFTPVLPGTYFVAATAVGFLPAARAKLVVESGETKTGLDITLEAGGTLVSGTVTDVLGGPIVDARVTMKTDDAFDLGGTPEYVVLTKADGTYQLSLPDGGYSARAAHDDYTSERQDFELVGEPVKVDFVLTPGGVIRGQVIARDSGKPVAGAWLLAKGGQGRNGGEQTARTDDDGAFLLRGMNTGAIELTAQGPGYSSTQPTVVELGVGEQVDGVRVYVDHAFSIYGNVVRKGNPDEGVPGIQLGMFSIATQQYGMALEPTDADGAFVIHGVRPASYMLFAAGEGNVPEIGTSVDVVDKDVTGVIVEMAAGITLAGHVEPPVAHAKVTLEVSGSVGILTMFSAIKASLVHGETDAQGAFSIAHAPSGAFTLKAVAPSGDTGKQPVLVGTADMNGLVVKLETRASISGSLVDDKGKPVAGATVSANGAATDEALSIAFSGRSGVTTHADGTFKIVGLDAGAYSLSARDGEGRHPLKLVNPGAAKVTLAKSQALTGVTLTVEALDGVIKGQIVDGNHRPVADAWVTAERPWRRDKDVTTEDDVRSEWDAPSPPVLTGADGRFTIGRLRRGTYKVVAEGPRGTSRAEADEVQTGASVTLTLLSLGTLSGKVTSSGKPVTAYDLVCDGPGEPDRKSVEAADGAYTLERLAPGPYTCTVTADAGTAHLKVEVPAGPLTQNFDLEPWGVLTGKIVDVLTKKPVTNVTVMASGHDTWDGKAFEDMMRGRSPRPDASGVFTLPRVPAGAGSITVMQTDLTFGAPLGTHPYAVKAGERVDVGTIEIVAPRDGDAGTFGFATVVEDEKLFVSSVKEGGPAALAAVHERDQVIALNGMPVTTLTANVASKLVSSGIVGVGVPLQLTLDRAGTPVQVSLVSVRW